MVGFFRAVGEELIWGNIEEWLKKNFPIIIATLQQQGILDLWLKVAAGGGSVWKSAINPGMKKQLKEGIAGNQMAHRLITQDPQRLVNAALETLQPGMRGKIVEKAPPEYWVEQVKMALS